MQAPNSPDAKRVRLVALPPGAMRALVNGQTEAASELAGVRLSEFLAGAECTWLWRLRLDQIERDPRSAAWVARAAVAEPEEVVVGHAGFHGPPDEAGVVEVGYTVDPAFRRRGYARAMLRELLRWAAGDPSVTRVRASISPDNVASLATIDGFGFTQVGEQWDDEDGLELVFEHRVRPTG
ncbi:MAG TPA: GNAT family N-acetyltransferase [Nocardioidaceae bacterium]